MAGWIKRPKSKGTNSSEVKQITVNLNPDIETRIRVQTIGAYSEDKKY